MYLNKKTMKLWQRKQEEEALQEDVQDSKRVAKHKLFIAITKYLPFIILVCQVLYSILSYYGVSDNIIEIINLIGCVSIPQLIYMYIGSYVFKYCKWYRYSLNTIILTNILALIDIFVGIPLSNLNMLRLYLVILITGLISYIKFVLKK